MANLNLKYVVVIGTFTNLPTLCLFGSFEQSKYFCQKIELFNKNKAYHTQPTKPVTNQQKVEHYNKLTTSI
jgi:hypothetical protein